MLGEVIGKVFSSLLPVQVELILLDAAAHQVETHVKGFGGLPAHVAGEYAILIGVGGCGWPIYIRAAQMVTAFWPSRKIAEVSASAVESMTVRMV